MYSFCVILPYFINGTGHWPNFIDWYFASCRANETIDFHIFTDDHSLDKWDKEKNIFFHHMSFDEAAELVRDKLDGAKLPKPYKFCDYKQAYGVVFEEWVKEYDYWASCDCDLMFGNIRYHFPDERLAKYDKMMVTGQFQISRNTEEVNHYYELKRPEGSRFKDLNWEVVKNSDKSFGYDEGHGVPMLVRENGKSILWDMKMYANIHQRRRGKEKLYNKLIDKNEAANRPFQYWQWKDGFIYHVNALTHKKTSKLFIHFTERKMKCDQYTDQKEVYITENSEFKSSISFKDTVAGWDFVRVMTKKTFVWIKWKLTHLRGKKSWEM